MFLEEVTVFGESGKIGGHQKISGHLSSIHLFSFCTLLKCFFFIFFFSRTISWCNCVQHTATMSGPFFLSLSSFFFNVMAPIPTVVSEVSKLNTESCGFERNVRQRLVFQVVNSSSPTKSTVNMQFNLGRNIRFALLVGLSLVETIPGRCRHNLWPTWWVR